MRKRAWVAFLLGAGLLAPAWAAPPPARKNPLPEPTSILTGGAISYGVVLARPDDKGFQAFFTTAWEQLKSGGASAAWLNFLTGMLLSSQDNLLLGLLPFQGVRVDRLDEDGTDHSATMYTLAGMPGLQALFWSTLQSDNSGTPYPRVEVAGRPVTIRPKPGQAEKEAWVAAREHGTFFSFSDLETARKTWEKPAPEETIRGILQEVDQTQDTYGVMLNKAGSLIRMLRWVNSGDTGAVEAGVGADRFAKVLGHVQYLTWIGDLIDDDQVNMQVKFHTDSEEAAEDVNQLLKDSRQVLKARGRAAELQLLTRRTDVICDVQMVGYRRMLQNFLKKN